MRRPTFRNGVPFINRYLKMQIGDKKIAYLKESIRFDEKLIVSIENNNHCSQDWSLFRYLKKMLSEYDRKTAHQEKNGYYYSARRYNNDSVMFFIDPRNSIIHAFIAYGMKGTFIEYDKTHDLYGRLKKEFDDMMKATIPISVAFNNIENVDEYWNFMANWGHPDFISRQKLKKKRSKPKIKKPLTVSVAGKLQ